MGIQKPWVKEEQTVEWPKEKNNDL
jgi:hypothetical protein